MSKYLFAIPDGRIFFIFFSGGEMISCLLMSFKLIYSSKSIRNSLISLGTLILVVSMLLPKTTGGIVSFEPPTGDPTRAQEKVSKAKSKRKRTFFIENI